MRTLRKLNRHGNTGETAESEEIFLKWKCSRLADVKILEYKIIRGIGDCLLHSNIFSNVRTIFICPAGDNKTIKE